MGQDKLSLPWARDGDKTVLTAVVAAVQAVTPEVTLLVPPGGLLADDTGSSVVEDAAAHGGPLAALARSWPITSAADLVFVVAGDLPGVTPQVLTACRTTLDRAGEACDGAVVRREGRWQPLLGCYRQRAGQAWQTTAQGGATRLLPALETLNLATVDADELHWPQWWTKPVHTPGDYEAWLAWHAVRSADNSTEC